MKTRTLFCIFLMALSLSLGMTSAAAQHTAGKTDESPGTPKLVIQQLTQNLGEVQKNGVATASFTFRNEGTADLRIINVAPSCGCTASQYTDVVAPGREGKIALAVKTEGFSGALTKTADIYTNDLNNEQFVLTLHLIVPEDKPKGVPVGSFIVGPTNNFNPLSAKHMRVSQGVTADGIVVITNTSAQPAHITKLVPNGDAFHVELQTLEEGKRYALTFASRTDLPLGSSKQTIKLLTDNVQTPELTIDLEVNNAPAVIARPNALTFVDLPVSDAGTTLDSMSKTFWVQLGRGGNLQLTSIQSDLPFLKTKIESRSPNGQMFLLRVGFSQKPAKGNYTGKVKIETNNPHTKVIEVPIKISAI